VSVSFDASLEKVKEYLSTIHGILSLVPACAALMDSLFGWLPISSAIKPWAYIVILLACAHGIWHEVSKAGDSPVDSGRRSSMRRSAALHMCGAMLLIGCYWILGEYLNYYSPTPVVSRTAMLFILTVALGLVFLEVSRAFAILALTTKQRSAPSA
jgi:hypothetical protein